MGKPRKGYPGRVRIKDSSWRVRFVKRITVFPGERDILGYCDDSAKQITIQLGQTSLEELKTFVHEILHAIDHEYKIKLKHKQIYILEEAIGDFIAENFS